MLGRFMMHPVRVRARRLADDSPERASRRAGPGSPANEAMSGWRLWRSASHLQGMMGTVEREFFGEPSMIRSL